MTTHGTRILTGGLVVLLAAGCRSPQTQEPESVERTRDEPAVADRHAPPPSGEGMWPWEDLSRLDERELRARGLELRLEEIWSPGEGGLAGAVVGLRGCTASFISPDGLMVTNHHCAYGAIQRNSTQERNLLEEGYLASSREEELSGHGMQALVFRRHTDVTQDVLGQMPEGLDDLQRMEYIERREKEIVARCESRPDTRCEVARVNDGLRFVLLTNLEIRDVRLVAAPPESLGSFGGEVDNWHWPRHSMDFTLLRAYVGEDGSPAEYSPDNVPYHPERWLEVSTRGVDAGDLVMVLGTPYSTSRYLTAAAVRRDLEWYYPTRVEVFSAWVDVLEQACREVPDACLATASDVRALDNALTNARGMIAGLRRTEAVAQREEREEELVEWIASDPEKKERWQGVVAELSDFAGRDRESRDRDFLLRYLLRGSKLLGQARAITKWAAEREKPDAEREPGYQERDREDLLMAARKVDKSLHSEVERRVLVFFLERMSGLEEDRRPAALDEALGGDWSPASIRAFVDGLVAGTRLFDEAERLRLYEASLSELESSSDSVVQLALALAPELDAYDERRKRRAGGLSRLRPPFLEALIAFTGADFYPDANATPRISFATVAGYSPRDGVWYLPFTTLSGLVEKNTGEPPFDAPADVLSAIALDEAGEYEDADLDDVPACFLSNADTTGGNSGSPVLDGTGRLVGLNFDRVYENIAGDYGYDPEMSRNIMVDVRAVLWYLDRVLEAEHLLEELAATAPPSGE
jgi:hypothetical protein